MNLRRILLRVMLGSLALAAAMGVMAVLVDTGDSIWRVVGTAATTAVSCALLIPVANMLDRERAYTAGLAGAAAIVVEFIIVLLLIWEIPKHLYGSSWEGELLGTAGINLLAGVAGMIFIRLRHSESHRRAGVMGLLTTAAACVPWLIAIWVDDDYRFSDRMGLTGGAFGTVGMLMMIALLGAGEAHARPWRYAGMGAALCAGVMWLGGIWVGRGSPLSTVIFSGLLALAGLVAHINLCLQIAVRSQDRWLQKGAAFAAAATAVFTIVLVACSEFHVAKDLEDLSMRLCAAGGIVMACATLGLFVLSRMTRKTRVANASSIGALDITCPRCAKKQSIGTDGGQCTQCGLGIFVRIEIPRCPMCEYELYGAGVKRCPECGASLGAAASMPAHALN